MNQPQNPHQITSVTFSSCSDSMCLVLSAYDVCIITGFCDFNMVAAYHKNINVDSNFLTLRQV